MRLQNKVIIVTGSCTGIGKAIAIRCVAEGASVIIHGLEQDLGKKLLQVSAETNPFCILKISQAKARLNDW